MNHASSTSTRTRPGPAAVLTAPVGDRLEPRPDLHGFGGLHGGFLLGALTAAMQDHVPGAPVRTTSARFHRGVVGAVDLTVEPVRLGGAVAALEARATSAAGTHVTASATFGSGASMAGPGVAGPTAPDAPDPRRCDVYGIPVEFVPFAQHVEIRPVSAGRPFAGGAEADLLAWIRLVEDDHPPDVLRLTLLMDALAPSYAAVLTDLALVPSLELSVTPAPGLAVATSPWVLLHATTVSAGSGWVDERLDAWGVDGTYLASAHQLRLVR